MFCKRVYNIINYFLKKQINLLDVQGSGRDGRILKEDMLRHMELKTSSESIATTSLPPARAITSVGSPKPPSTPNPTPQMKRPEAPIGVNRTEPIKGFKKAMVKSMTHALVVITLILFNISNTDILNLCCYCRPSLILVIVTKLT